MLISESWLKEWLDTNISIEKIADILTMSGIEVESIDPVAPEFTRVVMGKVTEVKKHPNADRLKVCKVDVGEDLEIICGAPNVNENMLVACAIDGAILPGGIKIKKTKMRGITSSGMLCSEKELGVSGDSNGIMNIENASSSQIGRSIREILDLDEKILNLKITPNRGDCLSVRGIAREISASTECLLKNPISSFEKNNEVNISILPPKIVVHNENLCGRFSSRIIKNVNSNVKTPDWILKRLSHAGQRSISVLVDISNYVMLELGRPSHIFDYDKISGNEKKIIDVRWAQKDEKIQLLNSEQINCNNSLGVISDIDGPIAIAGIMGGERTAVNEQTKNILIETAFWLPDAIRGRAQNLRILTDASHRFERGVDFQSTVTDLDIISNIIQSICGGELGQISDLVTNLPQVKKIPFRISRCKKVLGVKIAKTQVEKIFNSLNFKYEADSLNSDEKFFVYPPTYRFDLAIEEDLIEEVIRMVGYESIPTKLPVSDLSPKVSSEKENDFQSIKDLLVAQDFYEVINYGFIDEKFVELFDNNKNQKNNILKLVNPISINFSVMRHSLLPGLVNILSENIKNQQKRVRIFEIGRTFHVDDKVTPNKNSVKGVNQPYRISALIYGQSHDEQWGVNENPVDFFDLKNILENTFQYLNFKFKKIETKLNFLHPGRGALVSVDTKNNDTFDFSCDWGNGIVGYIGELHPRLCSFFDLPLAPIVFEICLDDLLLKTLPKHQKTPKVPVVRRDLAFIVDKSVEAGTIIDLVMKEVKALKNGHLLLKFELFDLYMGKGISNNEKSLAFMVFMQDTKKTLEDNMVDFLVGEIVKIVENNFSAKLRF